MANPAADPTSSTLFEIVGRPVVFIDFETTGIDPTQARAIEVAGSRHDETGATPFHYLINPSCPIPPEVQKLTRITDEDVADKPNARDALERLEPIIFGGKPLFVAHNALYDMTVLRSEQKREGLRVWAGDWVCTKALAQFMGAGMPSENRAGKPYTSYKLADVCKALEIELEGAHRADADIAATEAVFTILFQKALRDYRPIVNALTHPSWARMPDYIPARAVVYIVD